MGCRKAVMTFRLHTEADTSPTVKITSSFNTVQCHWKRQANSILLFPEVTLTAWKNIYTCHYVVIHITVFIKLLKLAEFTFIF